MAEGLIAAFFGIVKEEPVPVAGIFAVFHRVPEGGELQPAVIEHTVQHQAHSVHVQHVGQLPQVFLRAQQRVYLIIVEGVVAVGGVAQKQGRCVDHFHAQVVQIGHGLDNAPQVAAEAVFVLHPVAGPRLQRFVRLRAFAPAKAIRENFVAHAAPGPLGRRLGGISVSKGERLAHVLGIIRAAVQAGGVQLEHLLVALQHKKVFQPPVMGHERDLIPRVPFVLRYRLHRVHVSLEEKLGHVVIAGNASLHLGKLIPAGLKPQTYAAVRQGIAVFQPRHMINGAKMNVAHFRSFPLCLLFVSPSALGRFPAPPG